LDRYTTVYPAIAADKTIAVLLSRPYSLADAAVFGVYLYWLSADIGVCETSRQAFTASNIINYGPAQKAMGIKKLLVS
jgi:hypothetical protein